MKTIKNKKIKILAIALFATASIYAAAPVWGYLPGATTDPDCVPWVDANCTVKMAWMFTEWTNSWDAVLTSWNIWIGTDSPASILDIKTTATNWDQWYIKLKVARESSYGWWMHFGRSRWTIDTPTANQDWDLLAYLGFSGHDWTEYKWWATIRPYVDWEVSEWIVPGWFKFYVNDKEWNNKNVLDIKSSWNVWIWTSTPENKLDVRYNKKYKIAEPFNRPTTPQTPLCASDLDLVKRDVTKLEPTENLWEKCFDTFDNADGSVTYYQEYEVIDISEESRLSVWPNTTEIKNNLKIINKNDRFWNALTMTSLNSEPVYASWMHEKDWVEDDLKRYLYIQAWDFGAYDAVKMWTNATTPINMWTKNNGLSVSNWPALPEAWLDVSSLAHKFNVWTWNCPAGWTEWDYDGEADEADCLSPNWLLVRNGNVWIWTATPESKLAVSWLPSWTTDAVASWSLAWAVCITTSWNMYIDTDWSCAN